MVGAIPARYGSTRLPGKPLAELAGKPLIEHAYRRASAVEALSKVVVLTDDDRIAAEVRSFGGEVEMTPPGLATGTDRIAHAARHWPVDAVINIQGDWLIDPSAITLLARHMADHPDEAMATLAVPAEPEEVDNPNMVKVVTDGRGYALYFSRAAIPHHRDGSGARRWKHLGIYGYRVDTLTRLAELPKSKLESSESLEQLRALEAGIPIRVLTTTAEADGVDTPEDLARVASSLAAGA